MRRWSVIRIVIKFSFVMRKTLFSKKLNGTTLSLSMAQDFQEKQKLYELISGEWTDNLKNKKRKWFIIYPDSTFFSTWNWINIFLFIYTAIVLPFKMSFYEESSIILTVID